MNKYQFLNKNYIYANIYLLIILISISFFIIAVKWPALFQIIFIYEEVVALFFIGIPLGFFGMMWCRNQTGFIGYTNEKFEIKNRFILGNNFNSYWIDLEDLEVKLLIQKYPFIKERKALNVCIKFKKRPLVALTDESEKYIYFIDKMLKEIATDKIRDKISFKLKGF